MTVAGVRIENRNGIPVAIIAGEIDIVNAAEVAAQLFGAAPNAAAGLVVDLSEVTYLDSRGVHLLFELANRLQMRDQRLRLVVPAQALIRRVLLLTRVDSVIPLHETIGDALQALR